MYPWCALGHHFQGFLVGAGLLFFDKIVVACLWSFLYVSYQALSVIRKKDSAGLDVADFVVGLGIAILLFTGYDLIPV